MNPIPSECSMQGTDSNYSTWNDRNPSSCSKLTTESEWSFCVPQHTCAGHDSGGLLLSHISHAPFATRWYGTNHLYIKVGESRIRTTHTPTQQLRGLGLKAACPTLQSINAQCRDSNPCSISLRADSLKCCIDYGRTRGGN